MDTSHYSAAASIFSKLPLGPFSSKSTTMPDAVNDPSSMPASNTSVPRPGTSLTTGAIAKPVTSDSSSASSSEASLLLSTAEPSANSPQPSAIQTIEGKREREREKRIMPARLQRVSNLLAGSTLEDELSGVNAKQEAYILPSQTKFILYTGDQPGFTTVVSDIKSQRGSLFTTPEFVKSCRAREMIETPDFKQRDDTEMMGKTRSIRSEEDTSDAAYERRHRKPDNLEKKQRRLERERLVRDRQKLKERIDQLRVADARLLAPILNAREQQQKQSDGLDTQVNANAQSQTASPMGVDISSTHSHSASKSNTAYDASQNIAKLESLRAELLEEANDTLKRYDVLLAAPIDSTIPPHTGKRKFGDNGGDDGHAEGSKPTRSISVSGAFATKGSASKSNSSSQHGGKRSAPASTLTKEKKARKRSSQSPLDVKTKRLSAGATLPVSPTPFKPEDGTVRAENTYANIHARTSGGRFAPKSALSGTGGSTSKINTKGKWKAEGKIKPPKKVKSPSRANSRSVPVSTTTGIKASPPSAAAIDGKPKRVKIILNKRKRANLADESASSSTSLSSIVDSATIVDLDEGLDEMEVDMTPQRAARAALTLEEAQALLAKAMEDDDDDDDDNDDHEIELEVKREDNSNQ